MYIIIYMWNNMYINHILHLMIKPTKHCSKCSKVTLCLTVAASAFMSASFLNSLVTERS